MVTKSKPSTGRPDDLIVYDLARLGRTGRPARLVYQTSDPKQKHLSHWSSRLNDGMLWSLAAYAEVHGLQPVIFWRTLKGEDRRTRPWKDGRESALAYLHRGLESRIGRGQARQMLERLAHKGFIDDDPRYHRRNTKEPS